MTTHTPMHYWLTHQFYIILLQQRNNIIHFLIFFVPWDCINTGKSSLRAPTSSWCHVAHFLAEEKSEAHLLNVSSTFYQQCLDFNAVWFFGSDCLGKMKSSCEEWLHTIHNCRMWGIWFLFMQFPTLLFLFQSKRSFVHLCSLVMLLCNPL